MSVLSRAMFVLGSSVVLVACSSSSDEGGDVPTARSAPATSPGARTDAGASATPAPAASADGGSPGASSGGNAAACTAQGGKACISCCFALAPNAEDVRTRGTKACQCAAARCGAACATETCSAAGGKATSDACLTCLDSVDTVCAAAAESACNADANCARAKACSATCGTP